MNPALDTLKRPLRPLVRWARTALAARAYDARAQALFEHLAGYEPAADLDARVLIGSIRFHEFYFLLHLALADIFTRRGCTVSLLVDDFVLRHVDGHRRKDVTVDALVEQRSPGHAQGARLRRTCRRLLARLPCASRVQLLFYSALLPPPAAGEEEVAAHVAELRRGILSRHVRASHNRFFGGRPFVAGDDEHLAYATLSVENELIGRAVGRRLGETLRPDLFLCLDGLYSTFGPVADALRAHGARVLFHQPVSNYDRRASRRLIAVSEAPRVVDTSPAAWRAFESAGACTPALRREAERLVAARLAGPGARAAAGTARLLARVRARRGAFRRVVGLFPNLSWDGNVPDRDVLFPSFFDWLLQTLDWGRDRGILFVLREHPQRPEAYFPCEGVRGVLEHLRPGVTREPHVELVGATDAVDSYALVREVLDCSVVFNGTLGLEIPILGKPVVFAGHSPFSPRGVGYSPRTLAEYFALLETMTPAAHARGGHDARCRARALNAAAFHFIYNLYHCPMMPSKPARVGLGFDYSEAWDFSQHPLRPDRNPAWQRTIDRILLDRVSAPVGAQCGEDGGHRCGPPSCSLSPDTASRA